MSIDYFEIYIFYSFLVVLSEIFVSDDCKYMQYMCFLSHSPVHLTELIIAKHRNGPTGKVNLFFKNDCTKFIGLNERDAV